MHLKTRLAIVVILSIVLTYSFPSKMYSAKGILKLWCVYILDWMIK